VTRQAQETTRIDLPTGSVTLPFTDIAGSTRLSHTPTDPLPQLTDRRHARLRAAITDGLAPDLA